MLLSDKKVLLIGGKGGVGKTTVSSALAVLAAREGKKVLLVSTDPAHSLADVFDKKIGDQKTTLRKNLTALEIDPDHEVKTHIERVSAQMKRFTNPDLFPEIERQMRLTQQSPGAQEAALLERICNVIDEAEKDYDLLIFDTAPTGHTLRLLSLPEAMAAWTQGMLRSQKRSKDLDSVLDHLSPKAGKDINNPMADPNENASDGMTDRTKAITEQLLNRQRLFQRTRRLLQDSSYTSILFVLTPERLPIQETERALQSLTEEKLPIGGVVINRILPEQADGSFLARRREQEKSYLEDIQKRFKAWPNYRLYLLEEDVQGIAALEAFANNLEQAGFSS
ncbi:ArsA family ATPase [Idiomarina sp. HP20-50]|uniref:ArsA family ATPase n=1 Tax=Idiomarina sp. HP20-50 TaxID=3070813 RepID=UPI00294AF560|nr:ArsA family ATPase [Idiomarina sp. HP20-50]MDV6315231.1 ArsA family ATPase [Idiomarina sp. HP20-50]